MSQRDRVQNFASIQGFNALSKMYHLHDIAVAVNAMFCVEIGVFGGRTLIPMALASQGPGAKVVGIDPWSAAEATQPEIPWDANAWDWDKLYIDLLATLRNENIGNVLLVRSTAERAVVLFRPGEIDMLHVDGNHSRDKALKDVALYLPKVKIGGIIVLDDVSMPTLADAVSYVKERCRQVAGDTGGGRDDATFVKERN